MGKHRFTLWLEFEQWESRPADDPEHDFFNMLIRLDDGTRYALNVWTFKYFATALEECRRSGEHLGGTYLPAPDMFVKAMSRPVLEDVVADLIAHDGLKPQWLVTDDPDRHDNHL